MPPCIESSIWSGGSALVTRPIIDLAGDGEHIIHRRGRKMVEIDNFGRRCVELLRRPRGSWRLVSGLGVADRVAAAARIGGSEMGRGSGDEISGWGSRQSVLRFFGLSLVDWYIYQFDSNF